METPSRPLSLTSSPHYLFPTNTVRRVTESTNSPEFEFWNVVQNPLLFPQPTLLSADELFSDGFLLPLRLLPHPYDPDSVPNSDPAPKPGEIELELELGPSPQSEPNSASIMSTARAPILTASKRWKEIFKRGDKKTGNSDEKLEKSEKKREKIKNGGNNNKGGNSADLNIINIWPFSRSRSEGNNSGRSNSKPAVSTNRKVSSAPCSRSNSSGSRRSWPSSPGRAGVYMGRTSPVWQVRKNNRSSSHEGRRTGGGGGPGKGRVLNVPMCIGYRRQVSCQRDGAVPGGDDGGSGAKSSEVSSGRNGNLFSLRGLFSKKSISTI